MRRWTATAGLAVVVGAGIVATAPAGADTKPSVMKPTIQGDPVVGSTLTASAEVHGNPAPTISYQWLDCGAAKDSCKDIPGATQATLVVPATTVGSRLAAVVRAVNMAGTDQKRSPFTKAVTAAPAPEPTPTPTVEPTATPTVAPTATPTVEPTATPTAEPTATPTPEPDPQAAQSNGAATFDQSAGRPYAPAAPAPSLERSLRYMRPFPVVRVKGTLLAGGARISLLRVRAPFLARVTVRCERAGCHLRRRWFGPGRVRRLERFLRAGARITVRVSNPNAIGKYVRLVIRDGSVPKRRDACLLPGATVPTDCPPA